MKLTISSTSMMKPILHAESHSHCLAAPQRVLGLLESKQLHTEKRGQADKLVQYHRPNIQHELLQTAMWEDYMQLENRHSENCTAVFGFDFDGVNTWYQLWNSTTGRACWLRHSDDMNYDPFAILAMDALVTLVANWNGTLYQAPSFPNNAYPANSGSTSNIEARHISSLTVSDASTSSAGHLWFLVTVNPIQNDPDAMPQTHFSGWVSSTGEVQHIGST